MLITNFNNIKKDKYEMALKIYKERTGDKTLYIDKNAYVRGGRKDDSMSALRCNGNCEDLTEFWRIYDKC